jgi:hypothetical protein
MIVAIITMPMFQLFLEARAIFRKANTLCFPKHDTSSATVVLYRNQKVKRIPIWQLQEAPLQLA